jgi:hypothetical protein
VARVRYNEQFVEVICRAICRHAGYDPDAPVLYGAGKEIVYGPFGSVVVSGSTSPAWTKYIELARAIVAA